MSFNALCASFNALCALGFSSTERHAGVRATNWVSMHSVLWGSLQQRTGMATTMAMSVSMHSVLWGSLQPELPGLWRDQSMVSMHSVLWGSLQRNEPTGLGRLPKFQCTLCFGVLFNLNHVMAQSLEKSFNALCALGFSSTSAWVCGVSFSLFQCTLCFGVLFNGVVRVPQVQMYWFQCTLCFGVLFNPNSSR